MNIPRSWTGQVLRFWRRSWRTDLIERYLRPGTCLVDVGASIGAAYVDVLALPTRPTSYVGFEPNPVSFEVLSDLVRLNSGQVPGVVHPAALGSEPHSTTLLRSPLVAFDQAATLRGDLRPRRRQVAIPIQVVAFDDLRPTVEDPISMVKIDVEGAELEVLLGMSILATTERPAVLCEVLRRDRFADDAEYDERLTRLEHLLAELELQAYQIVKRPGGRLAGLSKVDRFSREIWTRRAAGTNDYAFLPRGLTITR